MKNNEVKSFSSSKVECFIVIYITVKSTIIKKTVWHMENENFLESKKYWQKFSYYFN